MSKESSHFSDQCQKVVYQHAEISLPLSLIPDVTLGDVKIKAEDCPQVVVRKSKSSACRHRCELSITQTITYKIPIQYSAHTDVGDVCSECFSCEDRRPCD